MGRFFFFFNDAAPTEIYTLSLHDALPIWSSHCLNRSKFEWPFWRGLFHRAFEEGRAPRCRPTVFRSLRIPGRSEEHTSELQSRLHLVCRLLLEKKKHNNTAEHHPS